MKNSKYARYLVWLLTVFFFAYQFILRVQPGVLIQEITTYFHIDSTYFAILAAFYYLGYAGMQVPMGILIDRYGIKYIVPISALICVIGNIPFYLSDNWKLALVGRFLIGFGSTAGALGSFKAVRVIFPENYSKMMGWTFTFGLIGAINGSTIINFFNNYFTYKETIFYLSLPGILIALLVYFLITHELNNQNAKFDKKFWNSLTEVFTNKQIILISVFGALLVGPLELFADVWGSPYFMEEFGFSRKESGILSSSSIYFGMCVGSPLLAWIADKYKCHYIINITCGVLMAVIFYLILEKVFVSFNVILPLTFIIGILCSYQVIIFASVSSIIPSHLNGIAISVVNMINMTAGSMFHYGVGLLLDYYKEGENRYCAGAYDDALYILPITLIIGAVGFLCIRPKNGIC